MADMYGARPVTHTRFCAGCDGLAITAGICGPVNICDECTASLTAFIRGEPGAEFRAELRFPLTDASPVSCGLRTDRIKRERRHDMIYLGVDTRHVDSGFEDLHVYACAECGRDRQTRTAPQEMHRRRAA
jgi:hypothetical protein